MEPCKTKTASSSGETGILPRSRSTSKRSTIGETNTSGYPDPFSVGFTSCVVADGVSLPTFLDVPLSKLS